MAKIKIDKRGYPRGKLSHTDLLHRQVAYREIYLPNREDYSLPFSKYEVHHIDRNKKNYNADNLMIVTREEHDELHGLDSDSDEPVEGYTLSPEEERLMIEKYGEKETSLFDRSFWIPEWMKDIFWLATIVLLLIIVGVAIVTLFFCTVAGCW